MTSSIRAHAMLLVVCLGLAVGGLPAAASAASNALERGRPVAYIVPYAAGGANDVGARSLAPLMEKELGDPIQVVNRPGAGGQVGTTAIATAKPDGYTIGYVIFAPAITTYLDPDRKAVFNRKSFQPLGAHFMKKLIELGYIPNALGPEEYEAFWAQYESDLQPLIAIGKAEIAK